MTVESISAQDEKTSSPTSLIEKGKLGKDDFLKLLMTQLTSQDPLNPADSTEFVAQLSQFASLEQLTNMGQKLDDLIIITGASNAASSVSLLGKDVRVEGDQILGPSTVYYELKEAATSVKLEVRNENGEVVKVLESLPSNPKTHSVTLEDLPEGKYTVRIEAKNVEGKEMKVRISTAERVRGVNFNGPVPVLLMESGAELPANQVVEILQPKAGS